MRRRAFGGQRPYVELAPLVALGPDDMPQVRSGRSNRLAAVLGVDDRCLVADLDRTMVPE